MPTLTEYEDIYLILVIGQLLKVFSTPVLSSFDSDSANKVLNINIGILRTQIFQSLAKKMQTLTDSKIRKERLETTSTTKRRRLL